MKKINLVKVFTMTVCLSLIISTVVFAKDSKEYKRYNSSKATVCSVISHPGETEFPE